MLNINKQQDENNFFKAFKFFMESRNIEEIENYLKNDLFVKSAIKYLDKTELSCFFWGNYQQFNPYLLDQIEVMKPLTLKIFNAIKESKLKTNLKAMIEIASQPGIHPMIVKYVDPSIQNNFQFISSIIVNTNDIEDFYCHSEASLDESMMRYGDAIGEDIQTNPMFWEKLNSMMKKKNPKSELFDTEKELAIAKEYFSQKKKSKFKRSSFDNNDLGICVNLQKGEYFGGDDTYFVTFDYSTPEQVNYMLNVFQNELLPAIGVESNRFKNKKSFIVPYLVDEFGIYTDNNWKSRGIGGTNIPEDLLYEFIKRMVEYDKCVVRCGDNIMKDNFSQELLNLMIKSMDNKTK